MIRETLSKLWKLQTTQSENHFLTESSRLHDEVRTYRAMNAVINIVFLVGLFFILLQRNLLMVLYWAMMLIFLLICNYFVMLSQVKIFSRRWEAEKFALASPRKTQGLSRREEIRIPPTQSRNKSRPDKPIGGAP